MNKTPKGILLVLIQIILFLAYSIGLIEPKDVFNLYIEYSFLSISLIGIVILSIAILQLNKNLSPFPSPKQSGELIETGLYKYVRHPIYTGILLFTFGYSGFKESLWKFIVAILFLILFEVKSRYEEELLSEKYNSYRAYMKKTNRFFPSLKDLFFNSIS